MGVHLADLLTREDPMGETAAQRKAREAEEAAEAESDAPADETEQAPSEPQDGPEDASGGDPSAETPGAPESGQETGELRWYVVTAPLPRPEGGAYRTGDRFQATEDDPRVRSHFSKLAPEDGDPAPDAVAQALDAPRE